MVDELKKIDVVKPARKESSARALSGEDWMHPPAIVQEEAPVRPSGRAPQVAMVHDFEHSEFMTVCLTLTGGTKKKSVEPKRTHTSLQIAEIWKEILEDSDLWEIEWLEEWTFNWSKLETSEADFLSECEKYNLCINSMHSRLGGKSLNI